MRLGRTPRAAFEPLFARWSHSRRHTNVYGTLEVLVTRYLFNVHGLEAGLPPLWLRHVATGASFPAFCLSGAGSHPWVSRTAVGSMRAPVGALWGWVSQQADPDPDPDPVAAASLPGTLPKLHSVEASPS